MNPVSPKRVRHHRQRRAVITVMIVMLLVFVSAMMMGFVRRAISDRRHARGQVEFVQAMHLADAAIVRVKLMQQADREYRGETWKIPAGVIHQTHSAEVVVSITDDQVTATAHYPADTDQPRRFTRITTLSFK